MSEEKKDDLFELIHCLDPAEKAYFTKSAQRHVQGDENNYQQLFQLIVRMPEFDADKLQDEMKKIGIATPLAAAKSHLKMMLYKAMQDYQSSRNTHASLLEGLGTLAFLYEKKQYNLLNKEIKRLKKTAELFEEHHVLLKIYDYERKIHKETGQKNIVKGMEDIRSEIQKYADFFMNQLQFTNLMDRMLIISIHAGVDKEAMVNELLTSELLASEEKATTLFSKMTYHQVHATAHFLKGNYDDSKKEFLTVLSFWENAPHLIKELPSGYRRILSNYLGVCAQTGDFELYEQILAKIRNSPSTQPADKAEIFQIVHDAELLRRMATHDWEGVAALMPSLEKGLSTYKSILSKRIILAFQYHAVIFYFLGEDYTSCKKWLREIIDASHTEQRMDIQRMTRLLYLLLLWKKENYDLPENELRSVWRYFENYGGGKLEKYVLELIKSLLNANNLGSQKTAFKKFQTQISHPEMNDALGVDALKAWTLAQLTGQTPREMLVLSGKN